MSHQVLRTAQVITDQLQLAHDGRLLFVSTAEVQALPEDLGISGFTVTDCDGCEYHVWIAPKLEQE